MAQISSASLPRTQMGSGKCADSGFFQPIKFEIRRIPSNKRSASAQRHHGYGIRRSRSKRSVPEVDCQSGERIARMSVNYLASSGRQFRFVFTVRCKSIIAVHGMNTRNDLNHPNKTWTHQEPSIPQESRTHWLRDLLPSSVPHARIMAYQYNANVAFNSSTAGVQEQAENLLQHILVKREEAHAHSRPIVFIAHSLGGIIVKQALATAYKTSSGELATIYVFTFALCFFGVPHRGSSVPRQAWASIVRGIVQLYGNSTNASFLNSVTEGSNYAEQLQDSFKPLLGFYNVFTVCETKKEGAFGIVGGSRIPEKPGGY
ncbi:hypothetical protein BU23DRAFT_565782 [Bimuria novae-zelandiae CBS 107.79]|uniref:DUF676 domain-containing protein n=1 Tax=Bimuria novae-zelandiae CBS 107.79 TaxID=1447943 RepID=A0A6A5VTR1_9PLEO|nr:hypothetical protein BU23DRAFT_565782 [Bimuria novae-zelandiae CBS 107.79]